MIIASQDRIQRYTMRERVIHWLSAFAFIYVLLTGLAFYSPNLYWLAMVLGGGPTSRFWHPWIGLLFMLMCALMYNMWRGDMRVTAADREWQKAMPHYIRNEDEQLPPIGRFNIGQKYFFWVMFWGGLLLVFSGMVLWFPERVPWSLHALRSFAVLIHVSAALITIGAFIIHIYMGTAVVRGGFTSIIRGEVSRQWARTHHALWLRDLK